MGLINFCFIVFLIPKMSDTVTCLQIVECRRVLKWTYAYGYYLPEQEQAKRQFFEYVQGMCFVPNIYQMRLHKIVRSIVVEVISVLAAGEAEAGLERLHQCAEKDLQNYLTSDSPSNDFNDFRTKLAGLTR